MRLTLTAPAAIEAADTDTRTLHGIAIPYGQRGYTSAGPLTIDAGAIAVPDNLRAVKLFREHGREVPIGYATAATDTDDALRMAFRVANTDDGNRALLEASEGVRDALSVELDDVTMNAGHVTAARLVAVAQVAVPAFAGAQLTATLTDTEQADVHDLAQQILDTTAPDQPDAETDAETPPEGEAMTTTTAEAASAPAALAMTPAATTPRHTAESDRRLWAARAAEAVRGATDAAQVNAALADITPAGGTGAVFPRPAWLGELWSPLAADRPLVNAIGVSPLTAMVMDGWKWQTPPQVAPYAGNKAEVPTNQAIIVPAQADAHRIAGGWDLDRIYVDFSTGFLEAFQQAAARDYRAKSQTYLIDGHAAVAGPPAVPAAPGIRDGATDLGTAPSLTAALETVVSFLTGNGANVSFIALASDVFSDFLGIDSATAPWWLAGSSSITFNGSADVAGTSIVVDPGAPAGTVLAGDRAAVSLWETGPINVTAVNLPNGGIDFGLFGYFASMVHDARGLAEVTVTSAATARNADTKKK